MMGALGSLALVYEAGKCSVWDMVETLGAGIVFRQRLLWLAAAAEGLMYLHSNGIAHGNIKASNMMLDAQGAVKWTDLALGHVRRRSHSTHTNRLAEMHRVCVCMCGCDWLQQGFGGASADAFAKDMRDFMKVRPCRSLT